MESLLKQVVAELVQMAYEQRQTNQLLTELNNNMIALIDALADDGAEPDALPPTDMDGNPI